MFVDRRFGLVLLRLVLGRAWQRRETEKVDVVVNKEKAMAMAARAQQIIRLGGCFTNPYIFFR